MSPSSGWAACSRDQPAARRCSISSPRLLDLSQRLHPSIPLVVSWSNGSMTFWPHIKEPLAPLYTADDNIELLLGAELYSTILQEGLRKGKSHEPTAQKTPLEWTLSGGCGVVSLHGAFRKTAHGSNPLVLPVKTPNDARAITASNAVKAPADIGSHTHGRVQGGPCFTM